MNLESIISEVLPTMIWAWILLGFFILGIHQSIKSYRCWYNISNKAGAVDQVTDRLWSQSYWKRWYQTFKSRWLAAPHNISMALKSAWRARERGLAIFAGVFLSSLVITTVLAYAVGLNQGFFQFSLEGEVFDAKLDFQSSPERTWDGRTNNSELWESFCDDLTSMEEFSDCSIVYGRQGIRVTGFFDES
ncbi:MAG: hypothetical protein VYA45_01505, partial [Candidatus Thermoplasmatota archaeon]|nr:hypothetical protein [Candidatus Thermoplasmatota archaeon]